MKAAYLVTGLWVGVMAQLYAPWSPSTVAMWFAGLVVVIGFLAGRFAVCGLALAVLAVGLNAPLPYRQAFADCHFSAQLLRPNESKRFLNREVQLYADNIRCKNAQLPAQTIRYWDNKGRLTALRGQRLNVRATLVPVHARLNPQQFDYEKHLLSKGIRLSAKQLHIDSTAPETRWLLKARSYVSRQLHQQLSAPNTGILLALLTGNRSALSPAQKASMQATGTSHLLAISGLHLALVGGLCWLLVQGVWALSWRLSDWLTPRHAGAVVALLAITAYAVFTGFDVPVKRAWVMFSLLIISWLSGRGLSQNSLLLAAGAVIVVSPYAVVSVGFYFSFVATFVVLRCAELPYRPFTQVIIMQFAIGLVLLPITWGAFGIISLSALLVNLLVIPWLGLWVLPWAIAACIVASFSATLAAPLWPLLDTTTTYLWQTIAAAERLGWTLQPATRPHWALVALAVVSLLLLLQTRKKGFALGWLLLFLSPVVPMPFASAPAVVVADRAYTSALLHNGNQAIILNPGRKYRHINDARLWADYLHQHRLSLSAIVLSNDKITRISSTGWLLSQFPTARVVTLRRVELPYPADYCQSVVLPQLQLQSDATPAGCRANLIWQGQSLALFPAKGKPAADHALLPKATLIWRGKRYQSRVLGAITLTAKPAGVVLTYQRQIQRLWRVAK